jgi:hypothetical protein
MRRGGHRRAFRRSGSSRNLWHTAPVPEQRHQRSDGGGRAEVGAPRPSSSALRGNGATKLQLRLILTLLATALVVLLLGSSAEAANVVVGNPLLPTNHRRLYGCPAEELEPCSFVNIELPSSLGSARSPVNGAIVRWNVDEIGTAFGFPDFGFQILALRQVGDRTLYDGSEGLEMVAAAESAPFSILDSGVMQSFETDVPIQAGDYLGMNLPAEGRIGFEETPGSAHGYLGPVNAEGSRLTGQFLGELPFSAEIQPAPTISGLSSKAGPGAGGTEVRITGTDLRNVQAVRFGSVPATSYELVSGETLAAVAPAEPPGLVHVSVTTVAGSSGDGPEDLFEYVAPPSSPSPAAPSPDGLSQSVKRCIVPRVVGLDVRGARRRARKSDCVVGLVRRRKPSAPVGGVLQQSPRPGSTAPAGSKLELTVR